MFLGLRDLGLTDHSLGSNPRPQLVHAALEDVFSRQVASLSDDGLPSSPTSCSRAGVEHPSEVCGLSTTLAPDRERLRRRLIG